jgi:hypothetical protein
MKFEESQSHFLFTMQAKKSFVFVPLLIFIHGGAAPIQRQRGPCQARGSFSTR